MERAAGESTIRRSSLAHMFLLCSNWAMERIDEAMLADALLNAPGWARVGLSAPRAGLRMQAASELVRVVLDRIEDGREGADRPSSAAQEQLPL